MRLAMGVAAVLIVGSQVAAAPPTLDERVAARRAVEEVLWRHRLWPAENAQPKPPLSAVLPDDEIRARVIDDLRKSAALDSLWHRQVTVAVLDAELDRMAAGSKAPEVFQEMLAALGNDRALAREAIARPALVDRLIRSWFAHDDRYQGEVKRQAESRSGGSVTEWTTSADEMPTGLDRLADEDDAYRIYTLKGKKGDELTLTVRSWPKRPFEAFWAETSTTLAPSLDTLKGESSPRFQPDVASCSNDTWHPLGGATPGLRYSHSAVWTGTEMIVFGGWTPGGVTATGGRYVPATDAWYVLPAAGAPSARLNHPAVWTGQAMVIWGGQQDIAGPYGSLGDGGRYSPATDSWSPIATAGAPSARRDHTMIWAGSRVIVFGGRNDAGSPFNTGARYDPSSDTWSATATLGAPTARRSHTAVWTGSQMIVWGGQGPTISLNTGGKYDPVGDTWTPTSTTGAPDARLLHTAVWTGSRMVIWGGEFSTGFLTDTGGRYDPGTDTWTATNDVDPAGARIDHATVWTGTEMIVWGGWSGNTNTEVNNGARYNPATDTWTAVTLTNAPERRRSLSGVWTGSEMIVWGGVWSLPSPGNFLQYLNNGARYSPTSDSWVPTSIKDYGPPTPRQFHTSTWTGAETVIWGGGAFNDGGRYIAATDSWFPTTTAFAPNNRFEHTAVWDGREVIIWGGLDASSNPINTGGVYDPTIDRWAPMNANHAPPAVALHTAVWIGGGRMMVWGGKGLSATSNQGGIYDAGLDLWTEVSTIGAPSGRYGHTAVWTGSRVVVWGGSDQFNDGTAGVNTGGRYDPATNTWASTSTAGAPQGRLNHAAVWTGSRMLVWGGTNASLLGDGARYDPAGDAWSAMSGAGAPSARNLVQAAWTGLEMIVWGGNNGVRLNTGGRYDAANDIWSTPTTAGAPAARDAHTVTWAGNELLVFGGTLANGGPTDTGATYCACTWVYPDLDGDGYGDPLNAIPSCDGTLPAGYIARGGDCNDGNANIHPGVNDSNCNGVDENCDGTPDELYVGGLSQCGLGVCRSTGVFTCVNGQIINDCTPGTPTDFVDVSCNNLDDDCDGQTDEDYIQREDYWDPTANGPNSRTNQTTVWTGTEMIVFGGDNGSGTVKTGGEAYAPASNNWRALPAGPAKRWRHTAVWSGSQMIVWGGDDDVATVYNTGSRYDPSSNTWAATTTTGAPAARFWHSAVWTGSRMIVWGGRDATNTFNTGSRYDPVGNTWSATTTTGAPTARAGHSAVWTGTEMIVWGGLGALATGSRYDPAANSWTALPSVGGFTGRYGHVAIWTGSEMIIWGGTDGTSYFNNGRRYNPSTNTWTAMTLSGAPSGRAFASVVWTGTEMIVWGGADASGSIQGGARYNPSTGTWSDMTFYFAPSDRARASSVWTGTAMIVWGGDPNGNALADGARYVPKTICGTGGCQQTGHMVCSGGVQSFQCTPIPPSPEVCDGLDNDCNTLVDDGIAIPSGHPVLTLAKNGTPWNTVQSWTPVVGANVYDTVMGYLSTLRSTSGDYTQSIFTCGFNDLNATAFQDSFLPSPGDAYWYLTRAVNTCAGNGTYNDTQPPQQGSRDAEINAAPGTCP